MATIWWNTKWDEDKSSRNLVFFSTQDLSLWASENTLHDSRGSFEVPEGVKFTCSGVMTPTEALILLWSGLIVGTVSWERMKRFITRFFPEGVPWLKVTNLEIHTPEKSIFLGGFPGLKNFSDLSLSRSFRSLNEDEFVHPNLVQK